MLCRNIMWEAFLVSAGVIPKHSPSTIGRGSASQRLTIYGEEGKKSHAHCKRRIIGLGGDMWASSQGS